MFRSAGVLSMNGVACYCRTKCVSAIDVTSAASTYDGVGEFPMRTARSMYRNPYMVESSSPGCVDTR